NQFYSLPKYLKKLPKLKKLRSDNIRWNLFKIKYLFICPACHKIGALINNSKTIDKVLDESLLNKGNFSCRVCEKEVYL
ncbi:MAG: Unknown protein, partial [uncultured Aureispira sp.]